MQYRLNVAMARPPDSLAQRIKLARQQRKMTQGQLAFASDMKQPDISKLELGLIQQTTGIARLAKALCVDVAWLERGDGEAPDWEAGSPFPGEHQQHASAAPTVDPAPVPGPSDASGSLVDWHTLAVQIAMAHKVPEVRSLLLDFVEMVRTERTRMLQAIADRAKQHTPKGVKG